MLGTKQTGLPDYRIANLVRDADLMPAVQKAAEIIHLRHAKSGIPYRLEVVGARPPLREGLDVLQIR